MLLTLAGRGLRPLSPTSRGPFVGRISGDASAAGDGQEVLRARGAPEDLPGGFRAYLVDQAGAPPAGLSDVFCLAAELRHVSAGDVVRIDPLRRELVVLYRRESRFNAFLLTERCDNYCLMCSQPPRERDDGWLVDELLSIIPLLSPETAEVGLTGGEPGILGDRLRQVLQALAQHLPATAVHLLSNGRHFARAAFAESIAAVAHRDLVVGIPIYSALAEEHDYVVQARGAFEETIAGVLNLKRSGVRVEIRVVLHAKTYKRLPDLARFLARNLCFVDHVALMGLEPVGFGKTNLEALWVDPLDYQDELLQSVVDLQRAGLRTSIYNLPLCLLPAKLHTHARQSISDWKNLFYEECASCRRREQCSGFFASATSKRSRGIKPF